MEIHPGNKNGDQSPPSDQALLEDLLDRWEEAAASGTSIAPEVLCKNHPHLIPKLINAISSLNRTGWIDSETTETKQVTHTLEPGDELVPGYFLDTEIGKGGFGSVWTASGPGGIRVALKCLWLGNEKTRLEWKSLSLLKTIRHPNLLSLFGYWISGEWLIIGSELADGTILEHLNRKDSQKAPGQRRALMLELLQDAATGIDYLHQQDPPLIHGDIKPSNLLIVGGHCKVGDFGLVREFASSIQGTANGLSLSFSAPEALLGEGCPASDQFSLALTYCSLAGHTPFHGEDIEMAQEILHCQPDFSTLDKREKAVLQKALHKNPTQRFKNCGEMILALKRAQPPRPGVNQSSRSLVHLGLIGSLILGLGLFLSLLYANGFLSHLEEIDTLPGSELPSNPTYLNAATGVDLEYPLASSAGKSNCQLVQGVLPPGLELDQKAGRIHGQAQQAGRYAFSVLLGAGSKKRQQDFVLQVIAVTDNPLEENGRGTVFDTGTGKLFKNLGAFAALDQDGSIECWGKPSFGSGKQPKEPGFKQLFSTVSAFAGIKPSGEIVTWGDWGGTGGVAEGLAIAPPQGGGFEKVYGNGYCFAALKKDGSVTVWGNKEQGGNGSPKDADFVQVFSNCGSFAGLKRDGRISAWGLWGPRGGAGAPTGTGFVQIIPSFNAYTALRRDGRVFSWGSMGHAGSPPPVAPTDSGYVLVFSTSGGPSGTNLSPDNGGSAFAALKVDGHITAWGDARNGGSGAPTEGGFVDLASNAFAFAALKGDGSISAWGIPGYGGEGWPRGTGFKKIYSTQYAFAALKEDGSIAVWGDRESGGSGGPTRSGYVRIQSTRVAFAALHADGSVFCWGNPGFGGTGGPTDNAFAHVFSNQEAFAGLRKDGSIYCWGNPNSGGVGAPTGKRFLTIQSPQICPPYFAPNSGTLFRAKEKEPCRFEAGGIGLRLTHVLETGSLPTGCILDAETGIISGTPERSGEFSFEIKAANATGSISRRMKMVVGP